MPAKRGAGLALALTAASSRRDRHQGHPPVATPFSSSIKPADIRKKTCTSQAASRSCRCRRVTPRAQQPGKHPAVHASEPAVEPHLQIFNDIVDHCCYAWNTLIDQSWKIMSIAHRDSAVVGHSLRGLILV
jgi:hypothetical protein